MTQPNLRSRQSVMQDWVLRLPLMQQTVLIAATRGPDGFKKYHPVKPIIRWFRRCVLLDAMTGECLTNPWCQGGGSFAGPSFAIESIKRDTWPELMKPLVDAFMVTMDEFHLHAWLHMLHAFEIVGYGHNDDLIAAWWQELYRRMVHAMHLEPESKRDLYSRLGDTLAGWQERSDPAIERDPSKRVHS